MRFFESSFWRGFSAPIRGGWLALRTPKILVWVAIPLGLNIGLYALFFYFGSQAAQDLVQLILARLLTFHLPTWAISGAAVFLKLLAWVILAAVAAISFTVVTGILAAPFNDALAHSTLQAWANRHPKHRGLLKTSPHASIFSVIRLELLRSAVLLVGAGMALLLGLIPFLQIPALVIGSWLLAFEYFGMAFAQSSSRLLPVGVFVLRHPLASFGFGSFLLILMLIPFASIIYLPLAVVGGTLLFSELSKP